MKKLLVVLVASLAIMLSSCIGKTGGVYGEYTYDSYYSIYGTIGGFPPSPVPNYYYPISPGTYYVSYQLFDGTHYYPSQTSAYEAIYSVSANPGEFLQDGADKYFNLYLSFYGLDEGGNPVSISLSEADAAKIAPKLGTSSWTKNGLTITVTNSVVSLTADQLTKLHANLLSKK
jgi:hypothetical protein